MHKSSGGKCKNWLKTLYILDFNNCQIKKNVQWKLDVKITDIIEYLIEQSIFSGSKEITFLCFVLFIDY